MSASKQLTTSATAASVSPVAGDIKPYIVGDKGVLVLRNNDATNDIVIGPNTPALTGSNGYRLKAGQVLVIPDVSRIDLFALAPAGSPVLDILLT